MLSFQINLGKKFRFSSNSWSRSCHLNILDKLNRARLARFSSSSTRSLNITTRDVQVSRIWNSRRFFEEDRKPASHLERNITTSTITHFDHGILVQYWHQDIMIYDRMLAVTEVKCFSILLSQAWSFFSMGISICSALALARPSYSVKWLLVTFWLLHNVVCELTGAKYILNIPIAGWHWGGR